MLEEDTNMTKEDLGLVENRPLVSMFVTFYNQRQFVREALDSAFAQTYSRLEIVISDDCSTDGTWAEIERYVDANRNRREHRVILNRNTVNLGVMRNFEHMYECSHGELIVTAAGDDVSEPNRVERIVDVWIADGRRATLITHSGVIIDDAGRVVGRLSRHFAERPLGAVMTYSRRVFSLFQSVENPRDTYEDMILPRRAVMLGSELYLPEELLRYRLGFGAVSGSSHGRDFNIGIAKRGIVASKQVLRDVEWIRRVVDEETCQRFVTKYELQLESYTAWLALLQGKTFLDRLSALRSFITVNRISCPSLSLLVMLLPPYVYDYFHKMWQRCWHRRRA